MKYQKKKIRCWIGAIILSIFVLTSCEDYFDKVPSDMVAAEDHYQTLLDAQISELGVFTMLQDVVPSLIMVNELLGDLTITTTNQNADLNALNWHKNITADNAYIKTSVYYQIIIAANEVLANLSRAWQNSGELDQSEAEVFPRLYGYLIGLRSWCHLTLVQLHGEAYYIGDNITSIESLDLSKVPLTKEEMLKRLLMDFGSFEVVRIDEGIASVDLKGPLSRISGCKLIKIEETEKIVGNDTITEDCPDTLKLKINLSEVNVDLPTFIRNQILNGDEGNEAVLFFSQGMLNINAVKANIFLELQSYDSASFYFEIAVGELEGYFTVLNSTYKRDKWVNIPISVPFNESMFQVLYSANYSQENPVEGWCRPDRQYLIKPSAYIMDLFNSQGNDGDIYRGKDISFMNVDGYQFISKYSLSGSEGNSNLPIYRNADMMLKYAEALNRMGQHSNALQVVNTGYLPGYDSKIIGVRSRVDLPPVKFPNGLATSEDSMLFVEDAIMDERAMELAFEGHRWIDLMRVANRRDPAYLADKVSAKFTGATATEVRSRLMDKNNWYLPFKK